MSSQPVALIVNVNARRGAQALSEATTLLRSRGVAVRPLATADQAQADAALRSEVQRGAAYVVVGGGDGTLSHAAGLLVGSRTALGVLPLGTGNTFARSVGVPLSLWDAARIIAGGRQARVDVGRVVMGGAGSPTTEQVFLNSVGLGYSAEIARQLGGETKRRLGLLAWPVVGSQVMFGHRPLDLDLSLDLEFSRDLNLSAGEPGQQALRRVRSHQLLIANGRYVAGPLKVAPDAAVDDHRLDILSFGTTSLASASAAALRWALGRGGAALAARQLRIRSRRGPVWVSVDGEVSRCAELELSVQPSALSVLVPDGFEGSEV